MRMRVALAVPLAGLLLAAGCARTSIGAAARVGDTRIAVEEVAAHVERGYVSPQLQQRVPRDQFQRDMVSTLIERRLLEVAARRLGVTVTDAQVTERLDELARERGGIEAFQQVAESQGVAKEDLRTAVRYGVVRDAVADKLVEDVVITEQQMREAYQQALPQLDQARIAHIIVRTKKNADAIVRAAREGRDFAELAKEFSRDVNTAAEGGELGITGNGEGKFKRPVEQAVFSARSGEIVGPLKVEGGYEIVKVIERRTRTYEQARDDLRRGLIGQRRDEALNAYLADLARELGVSVNPRFGRWDPQQRQVVAAGNDLSSPAPSPGDRPVGVPQPGQVPPPPAQPPGQPQQPPPPQQPPASQQPPAEQTGQPTP